MARFAHSPVRIFQRRLDALPVRDCPRGYTGKKSAFGDLILFAQKLASYEPSLSKKKAEVNYQNETIVSGNESIDDIVRPGSADCPILNGNCVGLAAVAGPRP